MPYAALQQLCPDLPYGSEEAARAMLDQIYHTEVAPHFRLTFALDPEHERVLLYRED